METWQSGQSSCLQCCMEPDRICRERKRAMRKKIYIAGHRSISTGHSSRMENSVFLPSWCLLPILHSSCGGIVCQSHSGLQRKSIEHETEANNTKHMHFGVQAALCGSLSDNNACLHAFFTCHACRSCTFTQPTMSAGLAT